MGFSISKGIAGYVANSHSYVISNNIADDARFFSEVDDPGNDHVTRCIPAIPITTSEEH